MRWQLRTQTLTFDTGPAVMGIVNVTPDSFSDGGRYHSTDAAVQHAIQLIADGADILDIGGESTRPYSAPVAEQEELDRVIPVIEQLSAKMIADEIPTIPISIDTSKATVADAAIAAGANIINDVTGLAGDPDMASVAARTRAGVCAMHMQGTPQTMQDDPRYDDVVEDIYRYLEQRREQLLAAGIEANRICLDPGIGFGKTHEHNIRLVQNCHRFVELGCPILIGHSRKGFIGKLLGDKQTNRDAGTLAITLWLAQQGMHIVRVHEVANTKSALKAWQGVIC
jgi:dihydropteroate synthase